MYTYIVSFGSFGAPRVKVNTEQNDIEEVLEKAIPKFEKTAPGFSARS